jgi:isopenicillin N synthase-like dioxygenase
MHAREHRVLEFGQQRHTIPFLRESRVDAGISLLPRDPAFIPFLYGDYPRQVPTQFVEFHGMEGSRMVCT